MAFFDIKKPLQTLDGGKAYLTGNSDQFSNGDWYEVRVGHKIHWYHENGRPMDRGPPIMNQPSEQEQEQEKQAAAARVKAKRADPAEEAAALEASKMAMSAHSLFNQF